MPPPETILDSLTTIADKWQVVAIVIGVAALALALRYEPGTWRSVHADPDEQNRPLAGDEFIAGARDSLTHAVTIRGGTATSFSTTDPRKLRRIIPELQRISVGTVRAVHYVMQRKQLVGIAKRVESPTKGESFYAPAGSKAM